MAVGMNLESPYKVNEEYWNCVSVSIGSGHYTIVDIVDYEYVTSFYWSLHIKKKSHKYVRRIVVEAKKRRRVMLHRVLAAAISGEFVDHRNRDTLDNRRSNLRTCTRSQNSMNSSSRRGSTSKYKGVYYCSGIGKWISKIKENNNIHHIGIYESEADAAFSYNTAATKYHGDFAALNIIEPQVPL